MISAWWLIPAAMVGVVIGVFLIGLCSAGKTYSEDKRKWWEDE